MIKILGTIRSQKQNWGGYKYYYIIKTPYGLCKINTDAWKRTNQHSIKTSINPTQYFKYLASEKHNNKYNYSKVDYINSQTDIIVICPEHRYEFKVRPDNHLNKLSGCSLCKNEITSQRCKLSLEYYIQRANQIHNNKYDYSEFKYINNSSKSKIICPIHGMYEQTLNSHIDQKQGCPFCGYELIGHTKTKFQDSCTRNNNSLGIFYIIKCFDENEQFYKVGITSLSLSKRYTKTNMPYKYKIIQELNFNPNLVWNLELLIKRYIKNNNLIYKPLLVFPGSSTECYKLKRDIK